jgi:hypothetical protein
VKYSAETEKRDQYYGSVMSALKRGLRVKALDTGSFVTALTVLSDDFVNEIAHINSASHQSVSHFFNSTVQ